MAYLYENTDFGDPYDNPTDQLIARMFEFILPLGIEDSASINEIVTEAIAGAQGLKKQTMNGNGWYRIESDAEVLVVSGAFIVAAKSESGDLLDGGGSGSEGSSRYLWPSTAEESDAFVGVTGTRIPDSPTTPGRSKVPWKLSDDLAVTYEQHPYDLGGPLSHTGPHWHMSYSGHSRTPGALPAHLSLGNGQ